MESPTGRLNDEAIRRLVRERPIPDRLVAKLAAAPLVDPAMIGRRRSIDATLTPALADVLPLVADGLSNKSIAVELGIGIEAVRDRVKRLLRLYDARNRTNLAAIAIRRGDVPRYNRRR